MRLFPAGHQPSISWSQGPTSWSYHIIIIIIIIIVIIIIIIIIIITIIIIFHNVLLQEFHALPLDFRSMYLMH